MGIGEHRNSIDDDGCNNFSGGIKHVDSEKMIFGTIGATRKACIDMDIPDKFHRQINNVQAYSIKDLKLHLFDGLGNELFCFRKTD